MARRAFAVLCLPKAMPLGALCLRALAATYCGMRRATAQIITMHPFLNFLELRPSGWYRDLACGYNTGKEALDAHQLISLVNPSPFLVP